MNEVDAQVCMLLSLIHLYGRCWVISPATKMRPFSKTINQFLLLLSNPMRQAIPNCLSPDSIVSLPLQTKDTCIRAVERKVLDVHTE